MGKTYSNSKGGDRKVAKSMDELETLIHETNQPSRFQRRKIMTINATTIPHKSTGHSMKASVLSSAAAAAVATPVRVEPLVSVHLDGVLQTAANQALPGSSVVVEVKEHLNNAMHELEEMSAALKPVTAIVAVQNASRVIPPAPLFPSVRTLNQKEEMNAQTTPTIATTIDNATGSVPEDNQKSSVLENLLIPVPQSIIKSMKKKKKENDEIIAQAIKDIPQLEEAIAGLRTNTVTPSAWPYGYVEADAEDKPAKHKKSKKSEKPESDGFFSGIADTYDNMSTTAKVVTGVVVVAAVAGAGYYAYKRFSAPAGDFNSSVNNDELA